MIASRIGRCPLQGPKLIINQTGLMGMIGSPNVFITIRGIAENRIRPLFSGSVVAHAISNRAQGRQFCGRRVIGNGQHVPI